MSEYPYKSANGSYKKQLNDNLLSLQKRLDAKQKQLSTLSTKDPNWFDVVRDRNNLNSSIETVKSRIENLGTADKFHLPTITVSTL